MTWLHPLAVFLEDPNRDPDCPVVCPFHHYCKPYVQAGLSDLIAKGRLPSHRACMYYQGLMQQAREDFLREPENSDDFRELAAERCTLQEEGV